MCLKIRFRLRKGGVMSSATSATNTEKMVKRVEVEGYEAVMTAIEENLKLTKSVFVIFCGSKDDKGSSWCPDCVSAEPIIEEGLKSAPRDGVFIICSVGDKTYWKDKNNQFRKDEKLKLTCVPTLIKWNTGHYRVGNRDGSIIQEARRLEEDQCKSAALVTMLFED